MFKRVIVLLFVAKIILYLNGNYKRCKNIRGMQDICFCVKNNTRALLFVSVVLISYNLVVTMIRTYIRPCSGGHLFFSLKGSVPCAFFFLSVATTLTSSKDFSTFIHVERLDFVEIEVSGKWLRFKFIIFRVSTTVVAIFDSRPI